MSSRTQTLLIAAAAALSGLLFGYDAGIIAGALLFIRETFVMSETLEGFMVSCVPIGAMLACLISGRICDIAGRRMTLFLTALCFSIGSIISAQADTVNNLIAGRLLLGIAIGIGSCVAPVYVSELADRTRRGQLVNLFVFSIQLGVFLSFLSSWLQSDTGSWRVMIMLGIIPAGLLLLASFILPESPRWLVLRNRKSEARKVLINLHGNDEGCIELEEIEQVAREENKSDWRQIFQPQYFKAVLIAIAVSFFTQTVGINAINYYAPTLFQSTGFATPSQATLATTVIGFMLVVSTTSSLFFIDRIGRRLPLLLGTIGILISLGLIAGAFTLSEDPMIRAWCMFAGALLFMAFHGISIGPACFLIPSEVLPARVRGAGMGLAVAFNWGANVLVAFFLPVVLAEYGVATLFWTFFVITLIGLYVFWRFIPETRGVSLERIELNLLKGTRLRNIGQPTTEH
ncbi:sugar porter family MFS transporter [Spongorhabdus nitratireducens]